MMNMNYCQVGRLITLLKNLPSVHKLCTLLTNKSINASEAHYSIKVFSPSITFPTSQAAVTQPIAVEITAWLCSRLTCAMGLPFKYLMLYCSDIFRFS